MFNYGGDNIFRGRFDFYEWSAPYYENSKEAYKALKSLKLKGKTLKAINTVGACNCVGKYGLSAVREAISDAGIETCDLWWEKYEHMNDVLVPWRITLCEPVQFVFDDNTTLEIFPTEEGGARIGVDSIPIGLIDGLNKSDLDSNELFKEFLGTKLKDIELMIKKEETLCINDYSIGVDNPHTETRMRYIMRFSFDYPYELEIDQSFGRGYTIRGKGDPNHSKINYGRFKSARKPIDQAEITQGRGDEFWIVGSSDGDEKKSELPDFDCFGISINETYIGEFLIPLLYKYYDPSIQDREEYEGEDFDWYGCNLYTSDSIRRMLDDIYKTIDLINENYDDPVLGELKSRLSISEYILDTDKMIRDLTDEEMHELIRKRVCVAVDFYERFCLIMEHMLKIPGTEIISFAGP